MTLWPAPVADPAVSRPSQDRGSNGACPLLIGRAQDRAEPQVERAWTNGAPSGPPALSSDKRCALRMPNFMSGETLTAHELSGRFSQRLGGVMVISPIDDLGAMGAGGPSAAAPEDRHLQRVWSTGCGANWRQPQQRRLVEHEVRIERVFAQDGESSLARTSVHEAAYSLAKQSPRSMQCHDGPMEWNHVRRTSDARIGHVVRWLGDTRGAPTGRACARLRSHLSMTRRQRGLGLQDMEHAIGRLKEAVLRATERHQLGAPVGPTLGPPHRSSSTAIVGADAVEARNEVARSALERRSSRPPTASSFARTSSRPTSLGAISRMPPASFGLTWTLAAAFSDGGSCSSGSWRRTTNSRRSCATTYVGRTRP